MKNRTNPRRETLKEAGYVKAESAGNRQYVLTDADGKRELWVCNKGHASYGITYRNTHLEFVRSL